MCGLFGLMTVNPGMYEREVLTGLAWLSNFRGNHSSGLATGVENDDPNKPRFHVYTNTRVGGSGALLESPNVKERIDGKNFRFAIGHTRFATIGVVNAANAHPYREGHIIGAHNGTMHMFRPAQDMLDKETDSRLFYRHLSKEGVDSAIDKAWHGAYALTWINLQDATLNFIRNKDRPLWMALSKAHDTFFWSSERTFLDFVNSRTNNRMEEPKLLTENILHTTPMGKIDFTKREVKKVWAPIAAVKRWNKKKKKAFDHEGRDIHQVIEQQNVIPFIPDKPKPKSIVEMSGRFYRTANGVEIKLADAVQRLKKGCTLTGEIPPITASVWWYDEHNFISNRVYHDPNTQGNFFPKDTKFYLGGVYDRKNGIDTRLTSLEGSNANN